MTSALAVVAALLTTTTVIAADYRGAIQYSINHRSGTDVDPLTLHISSLELGGSGIIWRDWLAQISGDVRFSKTFTRSQTNGETQIYTGEGRFSLFPKSRFPFQANFNRSDSRVDSRTGAIADLTTTRISFNQKYFTNQGGRYQARYTHRWLEQVASRGDSRIGDDRTDTVQQQFEFTAQQRLSEHDLRYEMRHDVIRERTEETDSSVFLNFLSHQFRPDNGRFSLNNTLSYTRSELNGRASSSQSDDRIRLASTARYRNNEAEHPWSITANAFVTDRVDRSQNQRFDQQLANAAVRALYEWTPLTTLFADVSAFHENATGREESRTVQIAGIRHRSIERNLLGFEYDWNTGLELRNETSTQNQSGQSAELNFGHGLSRNLAAARTSRLILRLTQRGRAMATNFLSRNQNISHAAALNWNTGSGRSRAFLQLRVSDDRRFGDNPGTSQLGSLQSSVQYQFNRVSRLSGNITLQAFRRDDTDDDVGADTDLSSSATMTYTNNRFLGANGLRIRSEIRYLSDSFLELANERRPDEEAISELSWNNRLDYRIGRLELAADLDLRQQKDTFFYRVFFSIRRYFDA